MQLVSIPPLTPPLWKVEGPLIRLNEVFTATVRYSRDDVVSFAAFSGDRNALHQDRLASQRANFGELVASDQQTASYMMGVVASHFADGDDGVGRKAECLNFNFAFRRKIFAEQTVHIRWQVREVVRSSARGGWVGTLDGKASVGGRTCVIGRGTVAVQRSGQLSL
jgi:acyl dehydratase